MAFVRPATPTDHAQHRASAPKTRNSQHTRRGPAHLDFRPFWTDFVRQSFVTLMVTLQGHADAHSSTHSSTLSLWSKHIAHGGSLVGIRSVFPLRRRRTPYYGFLSTIDDSLVSAHICLCNFYSLASLHTPHTSHRHSRTLTEPPQSSRLPLAPQRSRSQHTSVAHNLTRHAHHSSTLKSSLRASLLVD